MKNEKTNYGMQKITYDFAFKYYDKNGLVRIVPARHESTRESAESIADEKIVKIEKVDLIFKKIVDCWTRKDFCY